ncbi:MAG: YbbR-like domain-containing protein [Rhodothermales bacterium]|nr:YbbR-like domain-containing protein [Rhodothermales bacterium]
MSLRENILTRLSSAIAKLSSSEKSTDSGEVGGGVIAICLLVSGLLWFAFSMQESYPLVMNFPTEVINLDDDKVLATLPPSTVRVQIVGEGVSLFQVYYNPPTISLDASQPEIDIEAAALSLSSSVRVESVTPKSYIPIVEQKKTRRVPVRLDADITLPESFEFTDLPRLIPDSVDVTGGASIIDSLQYWPTEPVDAVGVRDSISISVALKDTLSGITEVSTSQVTLLAVAREFTGGQVTVDVDVRGAPSDKKLVTLDPSTITIRFRVLLEQFNTALQSGQFSATVNYNEIRSDTTGSVRPYLSLPPNLELRDVDYFPETLRYYNYLSTE